MKKTGELLKKSREEKGLSVHEVALSLKINPRILQSIEEGEQSALPAKTFLRGFVQSYAKFLKLDPQEVLRLFTEEMNASNPQPVVTAPSTEKSTNNSASPLEEVEELSQERPVRHQEPVDAFKNSVLTKTENQNDALRARTIAISIIGLLLVIIVYFVNSVVKKYQKEAQIAPEVTATIENTDAGTPAVGLPDSTTESETTASGVPATTPTTPTTTTAVPGHEAHKPTAPGAAIATTPVMTATPPAKPIAPPAAVTPPAAAVKPTTPTPATPVAVKPTTTPPVQAAKPPTPATTAAPTAPAAPVPAAAPTGKLTEVIIEATENVEIEYSSSKSPPQKLVLKPDQIHTFKSRSGVKLKISNGGGVNVIVNGQDRGAPGASGQPVQVSYE